MAAYMFPVALQLCKMARKNSPAALHNCNMALNICRMTGQL
jgi:hypothetical protein